MRRTPFRAVAVVVALTGVLVTCDQGGVGVRAAADVASPCAGAVRACVVLGARTAWLRGPNGQLVLGPVRILGGSTAHPSTPGRFRVTRKDIDHVSGLANHSPMPYSVFFGSAGEAFHEGSLVRPSAGCIHLDRATARRFYENLEIGDTVQILP